MSKPLQETYLTMLTNRHPGRRKLKLINYIAKSLGIVESISAVPAADIMNMIQAIRN
ncbi:hypothetical protein [Marinomonas polaris]|uniref:hypothetical protein n=1 Tax=Marinomonas polaris TaxID=293552 RepID=UPI003F9B1555